MGDDVKVIFGVLGEGGRRVLIIIAPRFAVTASECRLKLGWSTQIEAEQIRYGDLVLGWMREKVIWIAVRWC